MKKMGIKMVVTALAVIAGTSMVQAQLGRTDTTEHRGQLSEKDYKFVMDAARGGMMEVQMGQLAQQKGANQMVRNFGQRMVTDHSKANDELKQLAAQKGATLPADVSHHERSTMEHLQKETGKNFDKAYAKDMAKDHRKDVKEFQDAAKDVKDSDLRAWAQKTLPILQQHLSLAEQMEASVKNEK